MAGTPRTPPIILRPNRVYEPNPTGSRVHHEHDMNDAINARLDWVKNFNSNTKSEKEHEVHKAIEKVEKHHHEKSSSAFNIFVWANLYAFVVLVVLKMMRII